MHTVEPVKITTPDGVERELRFTLGARKRIAQIFGMQMTEALNKMGDGAIPGILWALLHDATGKAPDVSITWLEENLPADSATELHAAIMSAVVQGKTSKNEIEELLRKIQEAKSTISTSGRSALRSSESQPQNSGTDSSNAKSKPESEPTKSEILN